MAKFYARLLEDDDETVGQPVDGEEVIVEDEDEDEASPFERDDVEVAEAASFSYAGSGESYKNDKPGTFDYVAKRILRKQRKLGEIKSVSVKVMTLSDSRKRRMKELGILAAANLTMASVIGAAGGYGVYKSGEPLGFDKSTSKKNGAAFGVVAAATLAASSTAGSAVGTLAKLNYKTVLVEVTYKYGKKVFEVFNVTAEQEKNGVAKFIFNSIKDSISKFKAKKEWKVKESATGALLKNQQVAQALTEAYLFIK